VQNVRFLTGKDQLSVALLLGVAAALVLLSQSPLVFDIPGRDAGLYGYSGWRILQGEILYRDIFDHKPPLIFYLNALGLWLGSGSHWGIWILEALSLFAATALSLVTLRRAFTLLPAVAATVVWLLTLPLLGTANRPEAFALPLQFLALYLALRYLAAPRAAHLYLLGLSATAAFLLKPNLVGIWLAIALALFLLRARHSEWRRLAREATQMAAAAVVPLLLVLLYFAANGALTSMIDAVLNFNLAYASGSLLDRFLTLYQGIEVTAQTGLSIVGLAAWLVGVVQAVRRRPLPPLLLLALITLPLEFLLAVLPSEQYVHYFIPWMPTFAILLGYFFHTFGHITEKGKDTLTLVWTGALVLAMIALPLATIANRFGPGYHPDVSEQETVQQVVAYVTANTARDDYLLVWGFNARINYVSRRPAPSRFVYHTPFFTPGYSRPALFSEFLQDLQAHPPALIVDSWTSNPADATAFAESQRQSLQQVPEFPRESMQALEVLFDYIDAHYELVATAGPDGWPIYAYTDETGVR